MKSFVRPYISITLILLFSMLFNSQATGQNNMFKGAQEGGLYSSVSKAFDNLNKGWLQEANKLAKEDEQSTTWGNYEIVKGRGFYKRKDYESQMFCLLDKSTGSYIIPPATKKEQDLYEKNQIAEGKYWPERMFFLGSGKGSMAGAPKELDGCIWMEYKIFIIPDSVYKDEKKVPNKKRESRFNNRAGLFRLEGSELKEVFSFSPYYSFYDHSVYGAGGKWTLVSKKKPHVYSYDLFVEAVEAVPGTNYFIRKKTYIKANNHPLGEESLFVRYTKDQLYDWNGKPVCEEADQIFTEGGLIYIKSGKRTKILNSNLEEIYQDYTSLNPVTIGGLIDGFIAEKDEKWGLLDNDGNTLIPCIYSSYDGVAATVKNVFKKLSYTLWYNAEAAKYKQKGEFEKTDHYNARIADPALQKAYVEEMMQGSQETYLKKIRSEITLVILGKYNADDECFTIVPACKESGAPVLWRIFKLNVPIAEAPSFKEQFDSIKEAALAGAKLSVKQDIATIESICFTSKEGKKYSTILSDTK